MLRWAPTLVSARTTRLNKGRSSAQHVYHLAQNRRCLPPTRVALEHLATAVVAGHLMGRVRGLRHRQRLQHIIRPLQVEQAENFNGVTPAVTTPLILYMECTLASVQGSAIVTGLGVRSPGYASVSGANWGTPHTISIYSRLFLDSCAQRKLRHRILGH